MQLHAATCRYMQVYAGLTASFLRGLGASEQAESGLE